MENAGGVLAWTPSATYSIAASSLSTVSVALVAIPIEEKATLAGGPNPSIRFELGSLDDVAPDFFSPATNATLRQDGTP